MLDNAAYLTSLDKNTLYGTGIAIAAGLYVLSQAADYVIKKGEFSFADNLCWGTEQQHKIKDLAQKFLENTNSIFGKTLRAGARKAAIKYIHGNLF